MAPIAITFQRPFEVGFVEEEDPVLGEHDVRLKTLYSGVSAGTELTAYRGTNPYLHKRWEGDSRLFVSDPEHNSIEYPVRGWGYEEVGRVVERGPGVDSVALGSVVYGTWGHRTGTVVTEEYAQNRVLPEGVDPIVGVFSQIGAIALNGILDAAVRLRETVAVFGLGVVGQLVAQLAQLSGARVVGVDLLPLRLQIARDIGIVQVIDGREGRVAERVKHLTGGRGADVVIEASGSARALHEAIRSCGYSSRVVTLGFFQGEAAGLFLGEEFHHNRISVVCSQISGVAPDLQHRWDRDRLVRTFMDLAAQGQVQVKPLITHLVPASGAAGLFRLLDTQQDQAVQGVLDFREELSPDLTAR